MTVVAQAQNSGHDRCRSWKRPDPRYLIENQIYPTNIDENADQSQVLATTSEFPKLKLIIVKSLESLLPQETSQQRDVKKAA